MQTYFFISLTAAIISYLLMAINMVSVIKSSLTINKVYMHMLLGVMMILSALSTLGFGIAWIVEYHNATH